MINMWFYLYLSTYVLVLICLLANQYIWTEYDRVKSLIIVIIILSAQCNSVNPITKWPYWSIIVNILLSDWSTGNEKCCTVQHLAHVGIDQRLAKLWWMIIAACLHHFTRWPHKLPKLIHSMTKGNRLSLFRPCNLSYPVIRSLEPSELRGAEMSLPMSSFSLSALFSSCNNWLDDLII